MLCHGDDAAPDAYTCIWHTFTRSAGTKSVSFVLRGMAAATKLVSNCFLI